MVYRPFFQAIALVVAIGGIASLFGKSRHQQQSRNNLRINNNDRRQLSLLDPKTVELRHPGPTPTVVASDAAITNNANNWGMMTMPDQTFFPFHASNDKHCVTRQEIVDLSQSIRNLLSNNIRVFPRNGFLLGIIRHGGFLPQEHFDADIGVVYSDLDKHKRPPKMVFRAAGCAFKMKKTEDYWMNWDGLDPVSRRPYDFFGMNAHCGEYNLHLNAVYPYRDTGAFFYPWLSVDRFNHEAALKTVLRYNMEGGDVRLVDTDEKLSDSNYQVGTQLGTIFNTKLDCFTERQFYFTTIPVPCDHDTILTSHYGRNWNHVESRGGIGEFKEKRETKFESRTVSDVENAKVLLGGPTPICMG